MTKTERIKELKKDFQKLFKKLDREIKTTSRENGIDEVIAVIQTSYYVYHSINDKIKFVEKL